MLVFTGPHPAGALGTRRIHLVPGSPAS